MINANELRIGNYLKYNEKGFEDKWLIVQDLGLTNLHNHNGFNLRYDMVEPIPLTEQWLKDFGFDNDIFNNLWHKYGLSRWDVVTRHYMYNWSERTFVLTYSPNGFEGRIEEEINCEYVHSLQNLYFALTGKELTK